MSPSSDRITRSVVAFLRRLRRDDRAASAVEYGLILALVVLGMFAALVQVADRTSAMWSGVSTKVEAAR